MKAQMIVQWMVVVCVWLGTPAFAGDRTCYGNTSTTSYFACNIDPWNSSNCVWWTAYKRPDLAFKISGGGWSSGQWYDKFQALGFPVGSEPRLWAVVEFSSPGHVAYVEKVYPDGSFDVTEMDAFGSAGFSPGINHATYYPDGNGKYHRNNGTPSGWTLKGFIYYKESCDPSKEKCTLRKGGTVGWYPPVNDCQQASQWFQLIYDSQNQVSRVEPATKASCPLACFPPNQ